MAHSYSFYDLTSMPHLEVGELIDVQWQSPLFKDIEAPRTVFTLQRTLQNLPINVFNVLHEVLIEKEGRAKGVDFNEFILRYWFPAYYHTHTGLLMLRTKKDIARSTMRTLFRSSQVRGETKKLDLKSINPLIERYKGAWFTVANNANVDSQAFFGASIDFDVRFERALTEGSLINVRLDYTFEGRLFHIGLSDDYSLVVFDNNLDEEFELELVMSVKAALLDQASIKV